MPCLGAAGTLLANMRIHPTTSFLVFFRSFTGIERSSLRAMFMGRPPARLRELAAPGKGYAAAPPDEGRRHVDPVNRDDILYHTIC